MNNPKLAYMLFKALDHRESLVTITDYEIFLEDWESREKNIKSLGKTNERP